ncbi:MAG: molybdate ABC transporter permease subunit [Deltaproteobacteria bacterium]|nr:MAG: molybdate ABC transporter permease subunit [Deltaproteobacteria bacterium]
MSAAARVVPIAGWLLVVLLVLPVIGLVAGTAPGELVGALGSPSTLAALAVSLRTTFVALAIIILLGTPLAWTLSRQATHPVVLTLVELPVVLPPAVLGVALLETFGRAGWLGPVLAGIGVQLPFTAAAVVLAQVLVGAPLYVLTATEAFRAADDDLLLVARTLGASPSRAWLTVALPAAAPGVLSAAALAWARALGEFGATLMFAGNLPGRTQTLPLAIYGALERDVAQARAISVLLVGVALALLLAVRVLGGRRG